MMKHLPGRCDLGKLPEVFSRYPGIQAVYVFGSVASGKTHHGSDLDLAVLSHSGSSPKKLDLLAELARQGFCDVDLVFLDTEDIVLQYEAVHQNRLVYCTEEFDRGGLYSKIIRRYLDFQPYLRVQRDAYKQRLRHD